MITRSRGEIKRMSSPKVTSSTATPIADLKGKGINSPRLSEKAYSPRISELRQERSPRIGEGPYSPRTEEAKSSNLGQDAKNSSLK